jgi:calnexin
LEQFYDKTGFSIMFGPDKCGTESKYHFIIRFRNPKTGAYEEKHAKKSELPEGLFADGKTHLFTLSKHEILLIEKSLISQVN